jgi:hypothetical protein
VPAVRLARGAIVRMRDAAGATVSAHAGVVWITEENGALLAMMPGLGRCRFGLALFDKGL